MTYARPRAARADQHGVRGGSAQPTHLRRVRLAHDRPPMGDASRRPYALAHSPAPAARHRTRHAKATAMRTGSASIIGRATRPEEAALEIEFLATVAVIAPDPPASRKLYVDTLGLPLEGLGSDGYHHSERSAGARGSACGRCRRRPRLASGPLSGRLSGLFLRSASSSMSPTRRRSARRQTICSRPATSFCIPRARSHGADGGAAAIAGRRDRRDLLRADAARLARGRGSRDNRRRRVDQRQLSRRERRGRPVRPRRARRW